MIPKQFLRFFAVGTLNAIAAIIIPNPMNPSRPYLTTLTPLRGIAALIVVIFHSNLMLMAFTPIYKPNIITMGWLWVDFFFILSGFIISYVYSDKFGSSVTAANYWKYIKARFARVYPLHFVTMIWCLVCAIIILQHAKGIHPFFGDMLNPASALPSLFLVQSLGLYLSAPLNTPSWSLSTEWWMYMLFPLLVPYFQRIKMFGKTITLIGIIALFLFVKYFLGPVDSVLPGGSPTINVVSDFGFLRCMAGFLLGMFLYSIYRESLGFALFRKSWTFVFFFAVAIFAMQAGTEDILVIAVFPFIILSAAYNTTGIKGVLDAPFLQRIGDWSFSIYMVHVPIIYVFWIFQTVSTPAKWANFPPTADTPPDYTLGFRMCLIVVALTLLLASLTYRYVEVPARNYLNKKLNARTLGTAEVSS